MKQLWQVIVVGCVFTLLITRFFEPSYFASTPSLHGTGAVHAGR